MPTTTETPKTLGQSILAMLRANPVKRTAYQVAAELGMADDAGWDRFRAALDTIPASKIIRVRGQNGFLRAA